MGYVVGSEEQFIDNILPYREIEGSSALVLGGLNDFIQLLFKASDELKQATPLNSNDIRTRSVAWISLRPPEP